MAEVDGSGARDARGRSVVLAVGPIPTSMPPRSRWARRLVGPLLLTGVLAATAAAGVEVVSLVLDPGVPDGEPSSALWFRPQQVPESDVTGNEAPIVVSTAPAPEVARGPEDVFEVAPPGRLVVIHAAPARSGPPPAARPPGVARSTTPSPQPGVSPESPYHAVEHSGPQDGGRATSSPRTAPAEGQPRDDAGSGERHDGGAGSGGGPGPDSSADSGGGSGKDSGGGSGKDSGGGSDKDSGGGSGEGPGKSSGKSSGGGSGGGSGQDSGDSGQDSSGGGKGLG